MVSQDFAIALITLIKEHAWAVELFPEFQDEVTEIDFQDKLTLFIKQSKFETNEQKTLLLLNKLMNSLDNETKRSNFINYYKDVTLLNAALLSTLTIKIAGHSFIDMSWKTLYDDFFNQGNKSYFDLNELQTPLLTLLNLIKPITDAPEPIPTPMPEAPRIEPPVITTNTHDPLVLLIIEGKYMSLRKKLREIVNPNTLNNTGYALLHIAAQFASVNALKELLAHPNINVKLKDQQGKTADDYLDENKAKYNPDDYEMLKNMLAPKQTNSPFTPLMDSTSKRNSTSATQTTAVDICKIL